MWTLTNSLGVIFLFAVICLFYYLSIRKQTPYQFTLVTRANLLEGETISTRNFLYDEDEFFVIVKKEKNGLDLYKYTLEEVKHE